MSRQTHTYAEMEVSAETFAEVLKKLVAADYRQAIHRAGDSTTLDMHGIGLTSAPVSDAPVSVVASSMYGHATERGLVQLEINGRPVTQMEPKKAIEIGLHLIQAAEAAIADESHVTLMRRHGLSKEAAAASLLMLREIRQGSTGTVNPS